MKCLNAIGRRIRIARTEDRGAAALELAIALPVLILMAIGVADYGRAFFTGIAVANAAMAGAEFGAQNTGTSGNFAGITAAVTQDGNDAAVTATPVPRFFCRCPSGTADVDCTEPEGPGTTTCTGYGEPEEFVQVSASKTVSFILRYPGLPSSVAVSRTAILRVQ